MNPKSERKRSLRTCTENPGNTAKRKQCTWGKKERNIPHSEKELIFEADSWIGEAIEREEQMRKYFCRMIKQ